MVRTKLELNENLELECMPLDTITLLLLCESYPKGFTQPRTLAIENAVI